MDKLYPLIFKPIFKELIWGGGEILPFKGLPPTQQTIGESWELSDVEGNCSIVANGALAGKSLDDLIRDYGSSLLGKQVMEHTGTKFPLLIKFIDARSDLSVQVHPGDALAQRRHNSFGKTEMWYVVSAGAGAYLYSGFARQTDAEEYVRLVENNGIMDVLQRFEVKAGDVFFLPAGRVHAIGAGCFIAEIQQTSDITYRIYDYDRRDAEGKPRELHTALAKDAIDYTLYSDLRTAYRLSPNARTPLVKCPYFTTNLFELDAPLTNDYSRLDSFIIYIVVEGSATLTDENGNAVLTQQGQTALFAATTQKVEIKPTSPKVKIIETSM